MNLVSIAISSVIATIIYCTLWVHTIAPALEQVTRTLGG